MTNYNNGMKISGCVWFVLTIIVLVDVINSAVPQDRIDSQILDPFVVDVKTKRPFCNAFTGCGRKRSAGGVVGQNLNSVSGEGMKIVRLPLPLYRALLRAAASQEMQNDEIMERQDQTSVGDFNNRIQEIQQLQEFDIPAQKILSANRDQYES